MTAHQSTAWQMLDRHPRQLDLGAVTHLVGREAGWLDVAEGRVWITRDGDGADHVLGAGERLWLGRGERVLAEPWRQGRATRLAWRRPAAGEPQPRLRRAPAVGWAAPLLRSTAGLLRGVALRLLAAARSADAMASRSQGCIAGGDSIASSGALQ